MWCPGPHEAHPADRVVFAAKIADFTPPTGHRRQYPRYSLASRCLAARHNRHFPKRQPGPGAHLLEPCRLIIANNVADIRQESHRPVFGNELIHNPHNLFIGLLQPLRRLQTMIYTANHALRIQKHLVDSFVCPRSHRVIIAQL